MASPCPVRAAKGANWAARSSMDICGCLLDVPRHFEVAAYCKKTANYFLYFTDDTYKSVLFTTACSFLFYQSNRLDKGGVPGVREAQGRNRLCSRLD